MKASKRPTRFASVGNAPDQCKKLRGRMIMAGASPFISARLIQAWTLWRGRGRRLPPFFSPGFNNQQCLVQYSSAKKQNLVEGSPTAWTPTDLLGISNHRSTVASRWDCFQLTQLHIQRRKLVFPESKLTKSWGTLSTFPTIYGSLAETLATPVVFTDNAMRIQWCACLNSFFTRYQCISTVW